MAGSGFFLTVLGTSRAWSDGMAVAFPSRGFQLMCLLASAPKGMKRSEVASILWDAKDQATALANLRQLVARMRKSAPDVAFALKTDEQNIALARDDVLDLQLVEQCFGNTLTLEGAKTVLRLWHGNLLGDADDCSEATHEWLAIRRAKLEKDVLDWGTAALSELTRFSHSDKPILRSLTTLLISINPELEVTYRNAIDAFGRLGDLDEVDAIERQLRSMLMREQHAMPSPETLAVLRRIRSYQSRRVDELEPQSQKIEAKRPTLAIVAPEIQHPGERTLLVRYMLADVANALARYRSFVVLAPHSSFLLNAEDGVLRTPARCVDYVVSSFLVPGTNPKLSLRLVDQKSHEIIWANACDVSEAALSATGSTLAIQLASEMATNLELARTSTVIMFPKSGAYADYLHANALMGSTQLQEIRRARKKLVSAMTADPDHPAIAAKHAHSFYMEWLLRSGNDPQMLDHARRCALEAMQRDKCYGGTHATLGSIYLYQRRFDESLASFEQAELFSPHDADTLVAHAEALSHCGQLEPAAEKLRLAFTINPTPPDTYWWTNASVAFDRERYSDVIFSIEAVSDKGQFHALLASTHALIGDVDKARVHYQSHLEFFGIADHASAQWRNSDRPGTGATQAEERFQRGLMLARAMALRP